MPKQPSFGTQTRRITSATFWPDTATLTTLNRVLLDKVSAWRCVERVDIRLEALHHTGVWLLFGYSFLVMDPALWTYIP